MAHNIFVNYRREDARADARSIRDRLAAAFGPSRVFMDVDELKPGERFDRKLDEALSGCNVLLAVIGPKWIEILNERARSGLDDYVHKEIAGALRRGILVIPVVVGGAPLPLATDLPDDIKALILHQKQDVTHERSDAISVSSSASSKSPSHGGSGRHGGWVPRSEALPSPSPRLSWRLALSYPSGRAA